MLHRVVTSCVVSSAERWSSYEADCEYVQLEGLGRTYQPVIASQQVTVDTETNTGQVVANKRK